MNINECVEILFDIYMNNEWKREEEVIALKLVIETLKTIESNKEELEND